MRVRVSRRPAAAGRLGRRPAASLTVKLRVNLSVPSRTPADVSWQVNAVVSSGQ
jgi:hypothetical protein